MLLDKPEKVDTLVGLVGEIIESKPNKNGRVSFKIGNVEGMSKDETFYLNAVTLANVGIDVSTVSVGTKVQFNAYDPRYDKSGNQVPGKMKFKNMEARDVKILGTDSEPTVTGEVKAVEPEVVPELDYDVHDLGNGTYGLTFFLRKGDVGIPGELTIRLFEGLEYQRDGVDPSTNSKYPVRNTSVPFKELIDDDGRIEVTVTSTKKSKMYVTVEHYRREGTIVFDRPTYTTTEPKPEDPAADHFFAGVETGREDSRAWGRFIFANLIVGSFLAFILSGYLGSAVTTVVPMLFILFWLVVIVGILLLRLVVSENASKRFARFAGAVPRLFMITNNRLFGFLVLFAVISFWGWLIGTKWEVNTERPRTRAERQVERTEKVNNRASRLGSKSDRQLAEEAVAQQLKEYNERSEQYAKRSVFSNFASPSWWYDLIAPAAVHQNEVTSVSRWTMLFLVISVPIYFWFAISDELARVYRRITRASHEGDTEENWLAKLLKSRFGQTIRPIGVAAKATVHGTSGGWLYSIGWQLLREVLTGVLANKIAEGDYLPTMIKGRR